MTQPHDIPTTYITHNGDAYCLACNNANHGNTPDIGTITTVSATRTTCLTCAECDEPIITCWEIICDTDIDRPRCGSCADDGMGGDDGWGF